MNQRPRSWTMNPGEELVLSADLSADMEDAVTISAPTVTVYTRDAAGVYTDVTSDFTIENVQINASDILDDQGRVISNAGEAVVFRLTASTTQGEYRVVVAATGSDGTTPKTERELFVDGGE